MHGSSSDIERLAAALLQLVALINDPRRDGRLLGEAGVDLDPVFLPLLVRLGAGGAVGVVELAAQAGREHSTVSRQLARLEAAGLVARTPSEADGRVREAQVTPRGAAAVAALAAARRRLLDQALAGWSAADRAQLAELLGRFADAVGGPGAG